MDSPASFSHCFMEQVHSLEAGDPGILLRCKEVLPLLGGLAGKGLEPLVTSHGLCLTQATKPRSFLIIVCI